MFLRIRRFKLRACARKVKRVLKPWGREEGEGEREESEGLYTRAHTWCTRLPRALRRAAQVSRPTVVTLFCAPLRKDVTRVIGSNWFTNCCGQLVDGKSVRQIRSKSIEARVPPSVCSSLHPFVRASEGKRNFEQHEIERVFLSLSLSLLLFYSLILIHTFKEEFYTYFFNNFMQ